MAMFFYVAHSYSELVENVKRDTWIGVKESGPQTYSYLSNVPQKAICSSMTIIYRL